jgi:acyl carrier protein
VRADGTYLVSGGLGALGLRVAGWLVAQGARHIVLLGRRAPSAAAETELTKLREAGAEVATHAVDVADGAAIQRVVAALSALRGVVHAAGVPGHLSLETMDREALAAVLRPKVAGAWALHEATRGVDLDFFVMFSSIASAWGSKGQAHYGAANQFLDGLAWHRRACGLPGLSVNWGPWSGGGLATGEALELLERAGVGALVPAEGLALLGRAMAADATQIVAARIDWNRFRAVFESRGSRPWMADMGEPAAAAPVPDRAESIHRAEFAALARPARLERLRTHTQLQVARVLRLPEGELPPPRQGFTELGVDSLMAVEIRNRLAASLGIELPATLTFDYPEIERLAKFLEAQFDPAPMAPPPAEAESGGMAEARDRVADMTEAEAEEALLSRLRDLDGSSL